jgi:transcription initiation factor TFIIIB Brf1 subunit/transcription initiation factor TFIIB
MHIPSCPECKSEKSLIYDVLTDNWICKNCDHVIYGGYFDDLE